MFSEPLAVFLTFRTFGTWVPGDKRWSVHHSPDDRGSKHRPPSNPLRKHVASAQTRESVVFSPSERETVRRAIVGVCEHNGWALHAVNVRSNHVHAVITCDKKPEEAMRTLKSYATRDLRRAGQLDAEDESPWARHGSTRYLFKRADVEYAVWYTNEAQDGARFEPEGE